MSKAIFISFYLSLVWALPLESLAGDEDMLSPYTQFDPETGYFVPIEDTTLQPEKQDSLVAQVPEEPASTPELIEKPSLVSGPAYQSLLMSVGIIILLAGMIVGFRKYRQTTGR